MTCTFLRMVHLRNENIFQLMAVIAHIANTICEAPIERPQNINKKSKTLRKVHET